MRSSANYFFPSQPSDLEESPVFDVLIVYEDFETGKNARRVYDFLSEQLGKDCRFSTHLWKFEVLGIPKLRELAAKEAAATDIFIVTFHGGKPLPKDFKYWIEHWSNHDRHPLALVALYNTQPGNEVEDARNQEYLATVAAQAGMEFFSHPEPTQGFGAPQGSAGHARGIAPWDLGARREAALPRWGINE
jgi:hypothetical protein